MATKPKAGSAKKKAASASNKEVQKTQRERFIETARELGVDEGGRVFEKTFKKVVRHPKNRSESGR